MNTLPKGSNLINFSMFTELLSSAIFRSFSIKYVLAGTEQYTINNRVYRVFQGEYLLVNNYCEGSVYIESPTVVKGLCIDIAPHILSEVTASIRRPDTPYADIALDTFFATPNFLENKYCTANTQLGTLLQHMAAYLDTDPLANHQFSKEFYFTLAEKIVADHIPIVHQLAALRVVKPLTRKELYRKTSIGKEFIDTHFRENPPIERVAKEAGLSEYHFFRLFKALYAITPHQYGLQRRLETANALLKSGQQSISDIALEVGFSDIHSFSKAFKKHFGASPSSVR